MRSEEEKSEKDKGKEAKHTRAFPVAMVIAIVLMSVFVGGVWAKQTLPVISIEVSGTNNHSRFCIPGNWSRNAGEKRLWRKI